jgi:hemolysin III
VFNTASHFVAALLSLLGGVELITSASEQGAPWKVVSFSIYSASLLGLFTASTLHHGLEGSADLERSLRIADYAAIYPLIAGSFTPLCLIYLHNSGWAWGLLGTLWLLAACGVALTVTAFEHIPKWASLTLYVTMGWMGALVAAALFPIVGLGGLALLVGGGVAYTAGGVIYAVEAPNPLPGVLGFHEIWHVFVMLGALLHWIFMWRYALAYNTHQRG